MTRLQSYLAKACGDLGLRVEIPFQVKFTDGSEISAQVEMGSVLDLALRETAEDGAIQLKYE